MRKSLPHLVAVKHIFKVSEEGPSFQAHTRGFCVSGAAHEVGYQQDGCWVFWGDLWFIWKLGHTPLWQIPFHRYTGWQPCSKTLDLVTLLHTGTEFGKNPSAENCEFFMIVSVPWFSSYSRLHEYHSCWLGVCLSAVDPYLEVQPWLKFNHYWLQNLYINRRKFYLGPRSLHFGIYPRQYLLKALGNPQRLNSP